MKNVIAPIRVRKAKAEMVIKNLSLRETAKRAGVSYTRASEILNGVRVDPANFERLAKAIHSAPMPKEAALA